MPASAAQINFKTQELANLYLHGSQVTSGGPQDQGGHLIYFRNTNLTDADKAAIASLDNRIAAFQNAITDNPSKPGTEDFPYDKTLLKREFMEEVYAMMLKRPEYTNENHLQASLVKYGPTITQDGQPLIRNGDNATDTGTTWNGNNFSNMTFDQMKAVLNRNPGNGAIPVFDAYSAWIDAVFAEGNKMKNNPVDAATGTTIVSKVTTSIAERTINGRVYDRVSYDGQRYYLIAKGAQTYQGQKVAAAGYLANATNGVVTTGPAADSGVGLVPTAMTNAIYLEVDKDLVPVNGTEITAAQRNLSPAWYLYYWNEARVKVLRGQLNYKEAVTSEIRDDLAKANAAYADLEAQAGKTRAQSADGKTMNPDISFETSTMDFFEATNAKAGTLIFDNTGNDDAANYSEWGASRSALKTYIDRKSTQSQDAMLDYQTTLNRFNNAYEVMSKLQEKMDGLVKSQLRNV